MKGADPYGASKAIRPWDGTSLSSLKPENKMHKGRKPTHESFEEVRHCLSCKLPKSSCDGCGEYKKKRDNSRRKEILLLLKHGFSVKEVAKKFNVTTKTIQYYAKRYENELKDPCLGCRTPAICKAMGKPCTVKERWDEEWQ